MTMKTPVIIGVKDRINIGFSISTKKKGTSFNNG